VACGSWRGKEPPVIRGTDYCVAALEAAIWAVAGARDFRDATLRAANLGDEYPGHRDEPLATRRKLGLLAEAGVGTIIDLTDDNDWLTPYADHVAAVAA
jgi:hypothetical protein